MKTLHRIFPFLLLAYHLAFAWLGYRYILNHHGDAERYWFVEKDLSQTLWIDFLKPGTEVVKLLTFPLVNMLHLPFWSGFLIFSLISFLGIALLYQILKKMAGKHRGLQRLAMVLVLLPNLHFWTSLIGKEALLIVPLVVFAVELYRKKHFSTTLLMSLLAIGLIRPHIALLMLLSYGLSLLLTEHFSKKRKWQIAAGTGLGIVLFGFLLTQIQDFSGGVERIVQKYEAHIRVFRHTDAYVPLDRYPLPLKLFTFYFRPLPFEKPGLWYAVIGLENLMLLLLSAVAVFGFFRSFQTLRRRMLVVFPMVLMLFLGMVFGFAYANYGILMRTKIMVAPFLYLMIMEVFAFHFRTKDSP